MEDQASSQTPSPTSAGAGGPASAPAGPGPAAAGAGGPGPATATEPSTQGAAPPRLPIGSDAEWPVKIVDVIEAAVDGVHDKVVRPLTLAARALVFGIVAGAMALVLAVLGAVLVVRILDVYAFGRRVWASDVVVGGLLTVVGLALWTKRRSPEGA